MAGAPPLVSSQGVGSGGSGHTTAPPSLAPPMYNPTAVKAPKGAAPRQLVPPNVNGAHAGEAQQATAQQYAENFTTTGGAAHPQGGAPQQAQQAPQPVTTRQQFSQPQMFQKQPQIVTSNQQQKEQPSSQPSTPGTSKSRIDPSQVPRPAAEREDLKEFRTKTLSTAQAPQASSTYRVIDDGNCSPRFMRMTINQFPNTRELATRMAIPIACVMQPLAELPQAEGVVPYVADMEKGPVRCRRCRGYINCHVAFVDGGRHWTCNLCSMMNPVASDYFCTLDHNGVRRDLAERPEISFGSYDVAATQEYFNRPAMHPAFMFALDVSAAAVQSGLLAASVQAVLAAVAALADSPAHVGVEVGVMTFDMQLHFYNLTVPGEPDELPPMQVVPDIDDPFVPAPTCLVPIALHRANVERLLNNLVSLFAASLIGEAAVGSAIKGASMALMSNGGRVVCMFGSPPSLGVGKVSRLDDHSAIGTDREKNVLTPDGKFYASLAKECGASQVSVDLVACTRVYSDLVSLGQICRLTGGQLSHIPQFDASMTAKVVHEVSRCVVRQTGLEAVLRVRCSAGVMVDGYFGSFSQTPEGDIELPSIDADKTLAVHLKLESDLTADRPAAVQCALLYTATDGTRRIRVHTVSVLVSNNINTLFRAADLDALVNFQAKRSIIDPGTLSMEAARNQLIQTCVQILYVYRKFCATNPAPGQLILPESLKLLPLYTLGLLKNKALTGDVAIVKTDERAHLIQRLLTLSASETASFVYPRMFPLHNLGANHGYYNQHGQVVMPPTISLSAEKLDPEGAYLMDNSETMFLWLGASCPRSFVEQLFGVQTLLENQARHLRLEYRGNDLSQRVMAIVEQLRQGRASFSIVQVMQQKDLAEANLFAFLVEDRAATVVSYVDFLCHVHGQIQAKLV